MTPEYCTDYPKDHLPRTHRVGRDRAAHCFVQKLHEISGNKSVDKVPFHLPQAVPPLQVVSLSGVRFGAPLVFQPRGFACLFSVCWDSLFYWVAAWQVLCL